MSQLAGKTFLVMGARPRGIGLGIGQELVRQGAKVIHTTRNLALYERMFRSRLSPDEDRHFATYDSVSLSECDVTSEDSVNHLFDEIESVDFFGGIVYSVAGLNRALLDAQLPTQGKLADRLKEAQDINVTGLARVIERACKLPNWTNRGSIVALSFDTSRVYNDYGWMGPIKNALEGLVRSEAVVLGRRPRPIHIFALSTGPVSTFSSDAIPGNDAMIEAWRKQAPLGWEDDEARHAIAESASYLLGPPCGMTGQVIVVDGGRSLSGE